jgi:hypothetical protein
MKVYLDDLRPLDVAHSADDGWIKVMSVKEVITLLQTGMVTHLSLDNDLGDQDPHNEGYQALNWIEEQVYIGDFNPPEFIEVHSANSVRAIQMEKTIETIRRRVATRAERHENPIQLATLVDTEELPYLPFSQRLIDSITPVLRSELLLKGLEVQSIKINPIEDDDILEESTNMEIVLQIDASTLMCKPERVLLISISNL